MNLRTREFLSTMRKDVLRTCLDMEHVLGYSFDVSSMTAVSGSRMPYCPKFFYSISVGDEMRVGQASSKSTLRRKFRKSLKVCLEQEGLTPTSLRIRAMLAGAGR